MQPYPEGMQLDAITLLARAVKDGDFGDHANLAQAAYTVQGVAMRELIGSGEVGPDAGRSAGRKKFNARRDSKALLEWAEAEQQQENQVRATGGAPPRDAGRAAIPIPWAMILQLAFQVAEQLFKKKTAA